MEPLGYLRLLRRRWRLLVACAAAAAVAVVIVTPSRPTGGQVKWVAEAQLVGDGGAATPALPSVQLTMRTGQVPIRAAARLGYTGNPLLLARSISFTIDDEVGTLNVRAPGSSPKAAAEAANVFAEETIGLLAERAGSDRQARLDSLEAQVNQLRAQLADLDRQVKAATSAGGSLTLLDAQQSAVQSQYGAAYSELQQAVTTPAPGAGLKVLEPAQPDLATVAGGGFSAPRSRPVRAVIGGFGGLLLGAGLVLIIARIDPRLVTREEVEEAFALPVIATVPDEPLTKNRFEVLTLNEPGSALAEGYRSLRAALLLMPSHVLTHAPLPGSLAAAPPASTAGRVADTVANEPAVIVVTSAAPGDGKSVTVANLAVAMAESGRSVLVLGCDFRRPSVHRYFGVSGQGVMDVLRGLDHHGPKLRDVMQATVVPGVSLTPHGTGMESFGDVAASGRRLLDEARALADVVIVDTPPLLVTNDAVELIPGADTTVIVCRSNKTTKDAAMRSRDLLERLGASVGGVVLIGADEPESSRYGDYYRYRRSPAKPRSRWPFRRP